MHPKYKRMIALLREKEKAFRKKVGKTKAPRAKKLPADHWFVYILRCSDGSLYTGITNNLDRRVKMHNAGTASRYTRMHRPVKLVYRETQPDRSRALIRECDIKLLPKAKKEKLAVNRE